ncbi:MAG TPA: AMP-binding protein, partial [Solirubrobacteraceae bacterium]|nr:AMP-binding protein [Solirubrobacteraceae bacterium]
MRVVQHVTIDAPESAVWELIREPSLYPRLLRDVTRWEPIAPADGSPPRYRTEVRVGGVELGAVVEVTRSSVPHELRWDSVSGIEHSGRWRVHGDGERRCTAALELSYHAPAGVLGTIADAAALPYLHQGVHQSLARLKAEAEGREPARGRLARIRGGAGEAVRDATVLAQAGLLAPARPGRLLRAAWQLSQWDATVAGGCAIAATLHPDDCALVDERGTWTFAEVHRRTNALARGLQGAGVEPGDRVAILCRNHAGCVEVLLAASKLGADVTLLNTGLAAPQLREVLRRERPRVLVRDEEFAEGVNIRGLRPLIAWHDGPSASAGTLDELIADGDARDLPPPPRHGR